MHTTAQHPPATVQKVLETLSVLEGRVLELSHAIHEDAELAYEEFRSSRRCADFLASIGFDVEQPAYGLPTAFVARRGAQGPHIMLCAEYDALPEIGHACGHNIIAAASLGAAAILAYAAPDLDVRLTVLGTPAEERGGGKQDLIDAGAFDTDLAACLMIHPTPFDYHAPQTLALESWKVTFEGRASHASGAPELGRNALDGLVAGYTAVSMLRQHLKKWQQVHGVITDGGDVPNIVPERAEGWFYLRALSMDDLIDLRSRVTDCFEGAAQATGTTLKVEPLGHTYEPMNADARLASIFSNACTALGRPYRPEPDEGPGGSTDFGNVSSRFPSLHACLGLDSWPVVNHQLDFTDLCRGPAGDHVVLDGAAALALTVMAIANGELAQGDSEP